MYLCELCVFILYEEGVDFFLNFDVDLCVYLLEYVWGVMIFEIDECCWVCLIVEEWGIVDMVNGLLCC